ncbi:hypothetical protein ACH4EC_11450 [Streptomyces anulatus]
MKSRSYEASALIQAAKTELGRESRARLQPFQDHYNQAVRNGDTAQLTEVCTGKNGRWERVCVLDDGYETSMIEITEPFPGGG